MTLYISFNVKKVLDFLLKNGHVYTIRDFKLQRINRKCPVRVGIKEIGVSVLVNEICPMSDDALTQYLPHSGFNSIQEWKEVLEDVNKKPKEQAITHNWRVYHAEMLQ